VKACAFNALTQFGWASGRASSQ